jgi:hypothetical protein
MVEHRLHQRLAVVEGAFDGEGMDVVCRRRGHHAPLHRRDAAAGELSAMAYVLFNPAPPESRRRDGVKASSQPPASP